ncbi:Rhotekin-2 [Nymphon striatum]|nr:Rhotekin-2 [Nymphon striatum]
MREGTTKLLAACRHPSQAVEASKSLLTSNERMAAYMCELQKRKSDNIKNYNTSAVISHSSMKAEASKAKVCVSDIRMPLIWKDTDHFKNKGDYRRFAVFCLLKIGTEIFDTFLINNVDRSMTDITFDDVIIFNNIPADFEFRLEVYSHVLHDDLSIASTPRKLRKKIVNSVGRTVGRKLAATLPPKEDNQPSSTNKISFEKQLRGPKFDLVAHASLSSSDIDDTIRTHDLVLENIENPSHQLPLFGHFCCRLAAQPDCMLEERLSGYLTVVQKVGSLSGCRKLWAQLKKFEIRLWSRPDEAEQIMNIRIGKETKVKSCKEPNHSFIISNPGKNVTITAENDSEVYKWMTSVKQHIQDFVSWEKASQNLMAMPSPNLKSVPYFMRPRGTSLYDETPLKDLPMKKCPNTIARLNNHSSPILKSRCSSSSSVASSSAIVNPFANFH